MKDANYYLNNESRHSSSIPFIDDPPPYSFAQQGPSTSRQSNIEFPQIQDNVNEIVLFPEEPTPQDRSQERILLHDASKADRIKFLRKVYGVLTCQAILTITMIVIFMYVPTLRTEFDGASKWKFGFWWTFLLIVMSTAIRFMDNNMRKPPLNLVLFAVTTVTCGILFGTLSGYVNTDKILIDVGIIGLVCLCIVIFTLQNKFLFTPKISMTFVWILLFVAYGILWVSYYTRWQSFWIILGPTIFCTYMIVAHHIELKDPELAIYSDEYIYAAVNIFMCIFTKFSKLVGYLCSCCCKRKSKKTTTTTVVVVSK